MADQDIFINADGSLQAIYSDDLAALFVDADVVVGRASHVEPYDGSGGTSFSERYANGTWWTADLRPVDGPVLGPFRTRQQALDAERIWLTESMRRERLYVGPS